MKCQDSVGQHDALGDSLKGRLARREVMRLEELAAGTGCERSAVRAELARLVKSGEVECIRPISAGSGDESRRDGPNERYRLIRETDRAYLWEQEVVVRLPVTRMFKLREMEERRLPRRNSRLNVAFGF